MGKHVALASSFMLLFLNYISVCRIDFIVDLC